MTLPPKYTCQHGALTLCVHTTADPSVLRVRVTKRPADPFRQALAIPVGAVLLLRRRKAVRAVTVRAFRPRINYGHMVAGGEVFIIV